MTPQTMRHEPLPETSSRPRVLNLFRAIALAGAMLMAGGCLYHMPIQQGNFLDPGQVEQLQTGMTRSQVRFLLGTPMVPSGFDQDRWDYASSFSRRGKDPEVKNLTLVFEGGSLLRIEGDYFAILGLPLIGLLDLFRRHGALAA